MGSVVVGTCGGSVGEREVMENRDWEVGERWGVCREGLVSRI